MAKFECSYAGTELTVPTAEILAWAEAQLGSLPLYPPGPPGWPATELAGLASFGWPPRFRCRIGSLYWPAGASRFAVGHFLASTDQLNAIYGSMPAGEAATLVLDSGDSRGKVSTSLYMLPARPLAMYEKANESPGLYLLTLVDARYLLWGKWATSAVRVVDDTTYWDALVAAAASDCGITLAADGIGTVGWGYAPNGLDLSGEPAPLVLDAVCYACGLKVARKLDGSYVAKNATNDRTAVQSNLSGLAPVRASGGAFSLDRGDLPVGIDTVDDQPLALPEKVRLVVRAADGLHTKDRNLTGLDGSIELTRTGAVRGWAVDWNAWDDTKANDYIGALGKSAAVRTLAAVARRFAGIVPWQPEGVSEAVEWLCRRDGYSTFVHPAAWSDGIMELVGIDTSGGAGCCFDRVRPTGDQTTANGCKYYPSKLRAFDPQHAGGCGWDDTADVWVTPGGGDCGDLAFDGVAEYWAKKSDKQATVSGSTRPTYVALQRADCCPCEDPGSGWVRQADDCGLQFSGSTCYGGTRTTTDVKVCLPFPTKGIFIRTSTSEAEVAGDVFSIETSSVDGEIALFDGTDGKTIRRATGTGFVKATSGVYSTVGSIALADWTPGVLETDGTLASNTDGKVPSVKAVVTYVQSFLNGLKWKQEVRVASTGNVSLSSPGSAMDGETLSASDRALLKDQTTASENGIYVWNGASSALTRAADADSGSELVNAAVFVRSGTVNHDNAWVCTNDSITLGTTGVTFVKFGSAIGALLASNNLSDVASAVTALNNLLPSQTTHSGQFLQTDGAGTVIWATPAGTTYAADESGIHLAGTTFSLLAIPSGTPALGYVLVTNTAAPSTPASGKTSIYVDSTDKRFHDKNDAGTVGTTVVANAGATHQFVTAVSAAGVFTLAQPAFTDLSGGIAFSQMSAVADNDTTLAGDSVSKFPTQHAVKVFVENIVTGLLDFKGSTDCSGNPNYPAASKGDAYVVSVAGKIGGTSGKSVDVGDVYFATADNTGGSDATVGTAWSVLEHNLVGALLSANNLGDVANANTALNNLLPGQSGADRKTLHSDGTNTSWSLVVLSTDVSGTLPDVNLSGNVPLKNAANTFTNTNTFNAAVAAAAVTPSQITSDQNDYAPAAGLFQRWSSDASRTVTGMAAGGDGEIRVIYNVGSNPIVLAHQSASSTAANRFLSETGAGITFYGGQRVLAEYDGTTQRWRAALVGLPYIANNKALANTSGSTAQPVETSIVTKTFLTDVTVSSASVSGCSITIGLSKTTDTVKGLA